MERFGEVMQRAEKLRQLEQDKANVAHGLNVRMPDGRQVAALMRVLYDLVGVAVERRSVSPLIEWFHENHEAARKVFVSDITVACRRGCAHCCHMWVDASPAEILYIAKSISGQPRHIEAIAEAAAATGRMTSAERATFVYPCPMLRSGECSIYSVRPIVCRSAVSMSAEVCERAFNLRTDEEIVAPAPYVLLGLGYRLALAGALKRAGITYKQIELNSGLQLALTNANAEQAWLAGEDPFLSACRASADDLLAEPNYLQIYEVAFGPIEARRT